MDGRTKRVSLGPVGVKSAAKARREALERQAAPQPEKTAGPPGAVPLLRDFVAGSWKQVHFERYKPSGQRTAYYMLRSQLLTAFGSKPLDRISPARVGQWFDRYSRAAPTAPSTSCSRS